jgi:hypothetical protein
MTPDDPMPGLEEWLAELHAMGPMEFDPGRTRIDSRHFGGTRPHQQGGHAEHRWYSKLNRYLLDTNFGEQTTPSNKE